MNSKQEVGKRGEMAARQYLRSIGYKVYRWNQQLSHDEIDIIAFDPNDKVLVFAEVKTRSRKHQDYTPELNCSARKHTHMLRAARRWVAWRDYQGGWRLDLICVIGSQVQDHFIEVNGPF